ncbi:unnamed protein product, partial [Ascophyllum nodosum]
MIPWAWKIAGGRCPCRRRRTSGNSGRGRRRTVYIVDPELAAIASCTTGTSEILRS